MRGTAAACAFITVFALSTPAIGLLPLSSSPSRTFAAASQTRNQFPGVAAPIRMAIIRRTGSARAERIARNLPAGAPRAVAVPAVDKDRSPARTVARSSPRTRTVRRGDSLWTISRQLRVSVETLAQANDLTPQSILSPGQVLVIPSGAGLSSAVARAGSTPAKSASPRRATDRYVVQTGDTLWEIARQYDTSVEDLLAWNDLGDSERIKPGQRLAVSGSAGSRYRRIAVPSRAAQNRQPVMADTGALRAAGAFLWPSRGVITSRFGWRYRRQHEGIDIASPGGTPIYATRDGVVEFVGWYGGYGKSVVLQHGNGLQTIYGHASELLVQTGQRVKKGQLIARVGCTGACTGSHVHFEVRVNSRALDPLQILKGNARNAAPADETSTR